MGSASSRGIGPCAMRPAAAFGCGINTVVLQREQHHGRSADRQHRLAIRDRRQAWRRRDGCRLQGARHQARTRGRAQVPSAAVEPRRGRQAAIQREAQAASATNHRNICVIHNIEETDDGRLFIVMACYEGETLKQKLERGALPIAEAIEIASEIAEGLAKAHAQGVVHRDVKPGNLMITDDGVKILDFGLAKFADALQLTHAGIDDRHRRVHVARAGARRRGRRAQRRVGARRRDVRDARPGACRFAARTRRRRSTRSRTSRCPRCVRGEGREIRTGGARAHRDEGAREGSGKAFTRARASLRAISGCLQGAPCRWISAPRSCRRSAGLAAIPSGRTSRIRRAFTLGRVAIAGTGGGRGCRRGYVWTTRPVVRVPVAVLPVANHTGESEIDADRLALTATLIDELSESPNIRIVPYRRVLEIVRRFTSGPKTCRAARLSIDRGRKRRAIVVIPALVDRNGLWVTEVEFRSVATGTTAARYETTGIAASVRAETAYRSVIAAADGVQAYFRTNGPGRAYVSRPATSRFRTSTRPGVRARIERVRAGQEYAEARDGFRQSIAADGQQARCARVAQPRPPADAAGRRVRR